MAQSESIGQFEVPCDKLVGVGTINNRPQFSELNVDFIKREDIDSISNRSKASGFSG